jgi:hypothetical protein
MMNFPTLQFPALRGNQDATPTRFRNNALLEPVLADGLRLLYAGVTFKNGCGVLLLTRITGESGFGRGFC